MKLRDDDDDQPADQSAKKMDEVESLMQKYDDEEKHEAYMKSPEYKQELEKKKMKEIENQQKKALELQDTLDQIEMQKQIEKSVRGGANLAQHQLDAAKNDEFLENLLDKNSKDG